MSVAWTTPSFDSFYIGRINILIHYNSLKHFYFNKIFHDVLSIFQYVSFLLTKIILLFEEMVKIISS